MDVAAVNRIRHEADAMQRHFPGMKLAQSRGQHDFLPHGAVYWHGALETNFGSRYHVFVVYPENYPHDEVKAYVKELMGVSTPHRYMDGHLCLYANNLGAGDGYEEETTAVTITAWTAAWLNAWELYKRNGTWPGAEHKW